MDKIAVLIPCYNEAPSVAKVVHDFRKALPEATIYVYDNNSTDGTDTIARDAGAVVRYERQQGKGNVVRRMFQDIDAECYIMADGDDAFPAEDSLKMSSMVIDGGIDMVIGDRLSSTYSQQNKRPFHNFGNSLVKTLINHVFKADIHDVMTGYRALSYRFVKSFPIVSKGFEIETEMTIQAVDKNMNIQNHVIDYRERPDGTASKVQTIPDGIKVIRTILQLFSNYEPLKFFGILAAILAVMSIIFFLPVLGDYLSTGLVPRFPTLIVCGFTMIAALNMLFAGIILQAVKQKERREFEFRLQEINQWYKNLKEKI